VSSIPTLDDLPSPSGNETGWPWTEGIGTSWKNKRLRSLPKISIVTPSYNQGQYLEQTIRSVLLQGYPGLEYFVIDGGSTDQSTDILRKYDPWIDGWLSENDRGQAHAINKGLERCTGEIFNWLNSDDYLARGALRTVGEKMKDVNVQVLGGYARQFEDATDATAAYVQLQLRDTLEHSVVRSHFRQLPTYYRIGALRPLGQLNEELEYIMDTELWVRYLLAEGQSRVAFTDELLGHFRLHDTSKTVSKRDVFAEEKYSLDRQLYKSAFGSLPASCCTPKTEKEAALQGTKYNTDVLEPSRLRSYLLQSFATHCRDRLPWTTRMRLMGRALANDPICSSPQYRFILGHVLFPRIRRWYDGWWK